MNKNNKSKKEELEKRLESIREKLNAKKYTLKKFLGTVVFLFSYFAILFLIVYLIVGDDLIDHINENLLQILLISISSILLFSFLLFISGPSFRNKVLRLDEKILIGELATLQTEDLQDKIDEDFFTNLVKINFKYIDKYYLQTQVQADKSFTISLLSAIIAFFIILSGIILMYFDKTNSAYIATGTGVLCEFISAVFFYLYNRTIVKMGEYHHKLVLTQNVSLALKITEEMPDDEKFKSQSFIIEQLTKDINQHLISKITD